MKEIETTEALNREEVLFSAASELNTPEARAAYFEQACPDDPVLRARVEALLRQMGAEHNVLDTPAASNGGLIGMIPDPSAERLEAVGDRIGGCKLLEQIGWGRCGIVYMAEQERPVRRRVALKVPERNLLFAGGVIGGIRNGERGGLLWTGAPTVGCQQLAETIVQLHGWSRERRLVILRTLKPANPTPQDLFWDTPEDEVAVYVANLATNEARPEQVALLYAQRADTENVFDELKNQWGFRGHCSQRAVVTELAARPVLLTYNPWSLFTRLMGLNPGHRLQARCRLHRHYR